MSLSVKEKELVNIGASVATGCKPCTDFHFKKVRKAGATDNEIKNAIAFAMLVRDDAQEIMRNHGLRHLGITEESHKAARFKTTSRIKQLVSVGAAFAVNCTTNVQRHIALARTVGITEEEIESVLDAASFIKEEAAHYVDQIVKLEKKSDELQQLLDELKTTQAQLVQSEKMAALGKVVAGFAHELNTPIGVIKSTTDVSSRSITKLQDIIISCRDLQELRSGAPFKALLEGMQKNHQVTQSATTRIFEITQSLKSFTRLDESVMQRACIHEGLDSALTLIEHVLGERIKIVKDYGDVPLILCYPAELNQVYMHLLTNAVEAIKGKGVISIRTYVTEGCACIEITDTGIGILPDQIPGIFDPNFTKDGTRIKAGLGLFTSYNITQSHGGRIEAKSEVGKGSTFTVFLPLNMSEQDLAHKDTEDAEAGHRCGRLKS